jgi:DNA-binding CsgD family transcriptional regulator
MRGTSLRIVEDDRPTRDAPDTAVASVRRLCRPAPGVACALTPHEIRILRMLAAGDSYQAVGRRLGISINTVRNYIRSIYEKLQVHSKSEAVSTALRTRLIT